MTAPDNIVLEITPEVLLKAYACGIFPMAESAEDPGLYWIEPEKRGVLPLDEFHVPRRLARLVRQERFEIRIDTDFEGVSRACAATPRPGQDGTWITPEMIDAYCKLHELGFAHSSEAYEDGDLVGGCYGLSLGRAFFGESMFAHRSDASKVAFAALAKRTETWGFDFIDCQLHTDHLARFGAREWPRERFLEVLARALDAPTRVGSWP